MSFDINDFDKWMDAFKLSRKLETRADGAMAYVGQVACRMIAAYQDGDTEIFKPTQEGGDLGCLSHAVRDYNQAEAARVEAAEAARLLRRSIPSAVTE